MANPFRAVLLSAAEFHNARVNATPEVNRNCLINYDFAVMIYPQKYSYRIVVCPIVP